MGSESGIRNMTVGSPFRHILMFTLPLLAGNFLQQFYNMVDSWVVGNFVSDGALAAVGVGFPVIPVHLPVLRHRHRRHRGHRPGLRW